MFSLVSVCFMVGWFVSRILQKTTTEQIYMKLVCLATKICSILQMAHLCFSLKD